MNGQVNGFRGYLAKAPSVLHAIDLFPSLAAVPAPALAGQAS
jgi:hypothetical protein